MSADKSHEKWALCDSGRISPAPLGRVGQRQPIREQKGQDQREWQGSVKEKTEMRWTYEVDGGTMQLAITNWSAVAEKALFSSSRHHQPITTTRGLGRGH